MPNAVNDPLNTIEKISLYPNPAYSTLFIKAQENAPGFTKLEIFDTSGKLLAEQAIDKAPISMKSISKD